MAQNVYVVLGSNSFSGGWMVDTLLGDNKDHSVIGISRSPEKSGLFLPYKSKVSHNVSFYQLNLNSDTQKIFDLLDEIQPQYIINFAAQGEVGTSWLYPEQWFQTNTLGIVKLCNFLKDKKYLKCYVHISTPEVYGSCNNVAESAPINPSTPYAASKAAADFFVQMLVKQYGFPMIMVRSTNVYGAHQQLYRIIPRSIIYLLAKKKILLHGGGKAIKSYIHIKDVCRGILKAIKLNKTGSIYHFSPAESIAIRDLVKEICGKMGCNYNKVTENTGERPGQDACYIIDSSKARKELSWQPEISLEEGLPEVINWTKSNYNKIMQEPLEYVHLPY